MPQNKPSTRADRHVKRRNNNRKLLFLFVLALIFIVMLFSLITLGNNDKNPETGHTKDLGSKQTVDNKNDEPEGEEKASTDTNDVTIEQLETTDENVIEAYTGNWKAIGTNQTGKHETNYTDGSADRVEIKRAVSMVTGLEESNITEHWVGNDGNQKVTATVSNKAFTEFYRVYLSWVDQEGWQPTKVEKIKQMK